MEDIKKIREKFWSEFDNVSDEDLLRFYIYCKKVCEFVYDKYIEEKTKKRNEEKLNKNDN